VPEGGNLRKSYLRQIPAVDHLLKSPHLEPLLAIFPRAQVTEAIREVLQTLRHAAKAAQDAQDEWALPTEEKIVSRIELTLQQKARPSLRRVINATGIILHTGLGRAVLPPQATAALSTHASGYCNLEIDLETGKRGHRETHIEELLRQITGAERATVVNNNAAATMLVLRALAEGEEVIVSRGQLIEIGGGFRLPEIMQASGVKLKEVGTTNRTYLADYERAISEHTAILLHVHTSNYRIRGFASEVPLSDLVVLGKRHGLLVIDDIGSGALVDLKEYGFTEEPTAGRSIEAGADVVTFSADKLLGGPQAGIILGKEECIARIQKHPLARAVRVGKLTLVALEATLRLFLDKETLCQRHPTLAMLTSGLSALERRARRLARGITRATSELHAEVEEEFSELGGGSLPLEEIPTKVVTLSHPKLSAEELSKRLRKHHPPILARLKKEKVLLDLRTIQQGEEKEIVSALEKISENTQAQKES
jgi:L-seryl-tRNA(Ser) seleniumtransferase